MKNTNQTAQPPKKGEKMDGKNNAEGYPHYPASEDIYKKSHKEADINPDDNTKVKTPNVKPGDPNEKDFKDDMSGSDLDVPGSELDDEQEDIGSEDEENNFYSISKQ